jgi:uncharacterized protein YggL (DUF469 family)
MGTIRSVVHIAGLIDLSFAERVSAYTTTEMAESFYDGIVKREGHSVNGNEWQCILCGTQLGEEDRTESVRRQYHGQNVLETL